jgi:hypothetical protein
VVVRNKLIFYGEELLVPRSTPKMEDHPLSAVRGCFYNIIAVTLHMKMIILNLIIKFYIC